jgi:hypothetical protein
MMSSFIERWTTARQVVPGTEHKTPILAAVSKFTVRRRCRLSVTHGGATSGVVLNSKAKSGVSGVPVHTISSRTGGGMAATLSTQTRMTHDSVSSIPCIGRNARRRPASRIPRPVQTTSRAGLYQSLRSSDDAKRESKVNPLSPVELAKRAKELADGFSTDPVARHDDSRR